MRYTYLQLKFAVISIYFQLQSTELIKMSPHLGYQITQQKLLENQETSMRYLG